MQFYLATSFIFPRSLRLRLFAVCFVATHLPLLCYIGWGAATGRLALAEVVTLTLATVAGTGLALYGIGALWLEFSIFLWKVWRTSVRLQIVQSIECRWNWLPVGCQRSINAFTEPAPMP